MINLDYLYEPDNAKKYFGKNYFVDKKLGFQVIERGIILPHKDVMVNGKWTWGKGGIIDNKGNFIKNSFVCNGLINEAYNIPPESILHSSETVIYLGLFFPVWGHVVTDNIRRLWFLKSDFFNQFKTCSLVYIPWEGCPLEKQPNFKRLLEILEVDVDRIKAITQPTQFDKIVLADESFSDKFTVEYCETIERIRNFAIKNRTLTSAKKIYYFHGKKGQIGEERLAKYFKSKGYKIISPEKLTLDEQLNLLINCESFASTVGSCSHNSIFLHEGTETIFIPRAAAFVYYQDMLNQIHSLNINYIDSTLSIFYKYPDRFFCYIISEQLKKFFGDKWSGYEKEDFIVFLQYVKNVMKNSLNKGLEMHSDALTYYYKIFPEFMGQFNRREDL